MKYQSSPPHNAILLPFFYSLDFNFLCSFFSTFVMLTSFYYIMCVGMCVCV